MCHFVTSALHTSPFHLHAHISSLSAYNKMGWLHCGSILKTFVVGFAQICFLCKYIFQHLNILPVVYLI